MAYHKYTEAEVAYARHWNKIIEDEWRERLDADLKPATRAEDSWRIEQQRDEFKGGKP